MFKLNPNESTKFLKLVLTKLILELKILQVTGSALIVSWMQDIAFVLLRGKNAKNVEKSGILQGLAEEVSLHHHQAIITSTHQPEMEIDLMEMETDLIGPNNFSEVEAVDNLPAKSIQILT